MQKIIDSTYQQAIEAGCDCVQVKHSGMWTQFHIHDGRCSMRTTFQEEPVAWSVGFPKDMDCILIGSSTLSRNQHFIYDCWAAGDELHLQNLADAEYRNRFALARIQVRMSGEKFTLVTNHAIGNAPALWKTLPYTEGAVGLVFRNSRDRVSAPLRVVRWYAERPGELV